MIQPREETLQDDFRSICDGHGFQRNHRVEGDGCFYSVAKSTHKKTGLLKLNKRRNFPTPMVI